MGDRWGRNKRCEACRSKEARFHYAGKRLCSSCKSDWQSCDNQRGGGGHPVQGCFTKGMRRR